MVPTTTQYPILLPKASSTLTTLLIRHFHITYLHVGPQMMLSLIRRQYWIQFGRSVMRKTVLKCATGACYRAPTPSQRVRASRPFSHVGIDFSGKRIIKEGCRRNARSIKWYLTMYVCMAVKATHIKVVADLSTNAFIAFLYRFVSRRGIPVNIYSDCGITLREPTDSCSHFSSTPPAFNHTVPFEDGLSLRIPEKTE